MDKYEMDEILNMAIMTKTPHILVEGVNDVCVYEAIADSVGANREIYCIEMIEGYAGGNNGVSDAVQYCCTLPVRGHKIEDYVMGVVDRDARFYRAEIPSDPALLVLQYYSIESHFASREVIESVIRRITRVPSGDELDIGRVFCGVENGIRDLYYFSLDALRNAVDPAYSSIVAFSCNPGRRRDANTIALLQSRKDDLDAFAIAQGLADSFESIRTFSKGKWLLTAFSEELHREVTALVGKCKSGAINQCRMCRLDLNAPCLFRLEEGFGKNTIYSLLLKEIDAPEIDYIRERLSLLSESASA